MTTGRTKERNGFSAIQQSVVVSESNNHDGSDDDLSVDNNRLLLDGVHTEDSSLGQVDTARQRAKRSAVAELTWGYRRASRRHRRSRW
jgi:hypothetical protein